MNEKDKIIEIMRKRLTELSGSCQTDDIPLDEKSAKIVMGFACELADTLITNGMGDVSEWKRRAKTAERAVREFSVQVGCRSCPFRGRCGVSYPDARNDYQDCYEAALRESAREIGEKEQK